MRYPEGMIATFELALPEPKAGSWFLLAGPSSLNAGLLQGIARLPAFKPQEQAPDSAPPGGGPAPAPQEGGPAGVRVLDGGNRFNAFTLARAAGGRRDILNRITVSRAFTCFQVLALLESTPASSNPFVALDLLRTFYDESVPAGERKRLLRECIRQLQRLAGASGGLVSVHPPAVASPAALDLLRLLEQAATETFFVQPPPAEAEAARRSACPPLPASAAWGSGVPERGRMPTPLPVQMRLF